MKRYVILAYDVYGDSGDYLVGIFDDFESAKKEMERWSCYSKTEEDGVTVYTVQMPLLTYECTIKEYDANMFLTKELI